MRLSMSLVEHCMVVAALQCQDGSVVSLPSHGMAQAEVGHETRSKRQESSDPGQLPARCKYAKPKVWSPSGACPGSETVASDVP